MPQTRNLGTAVCSGHARVCVQLPALSDALCMTWAIWFLGQSEVTYPVSRDVTRVWNPLWCKLACNQAPAEVVCVVPGAWPCSVFRSCTSKQTICRGSSAGLRKSAFCHPFLALWKRLLSEEEFFKKKKKKQKSCFIHRCIYVYPSKYRGNPYLLGFLKAKRFILLLQHQRAKRKKQLL